MNLIAKTALAAAELLIEARKSGPINDLPDNCRPTNIGDVYAIHDAVAAKLGPVLGWKVGAMTIPTLTLRLLLNIYP
jgi:hypothetical protein